MEISGGKLKSVVQHCIYEISTGKWKPGEKLPSVRNAEKMWGVNRLTVLSAYRELSEMGLVSSEDRKGYFVKRQSVSSVTASQQKELDALYNKTIAMLRKNTQFEASAVLKYFASLIEKENEQHPEAAFLECSIFQAQGHANEIRHKLNVPILPLLLESGIQVKIPENVKTLLTTGFHISEVKKLGRSLDLKVVNIPIEVNPNLFHEIEVRFSSATIFELENAMSRDIFNDVKALAMNIPLNEKVVTDIDGEISDFLGSSSDQIILLSPRVWGKTSKKLQQNPRVHLIRFTIKKDAWPTIIDVARLPFRSSHQASN